jgi:hypothetical protein
MTEVFSFPVWVPALFVVLGFGPLWFIKVGRDLGASAWRSVPCVLATALLWGLAVPTFAGHRVVVTEEEITDQKE